MIRVRGIYDGTYVRLLDPVTIPRDTEVEVLIPEREVEVEAAFYQRLINAGIIEPPEAAADDDLSDEPFVPIPNPGEPISETIIRDRR